MLGVVFEAQKKLLALDRSAANRAALYETCRELARAPDEHAELRLEADMLLMEKDLSSRNASPDERAKALTDLITKYRGTSAEAKSLMIAVLVARRLENFGLEKRIMARMDDRLQGDHDLIEFRRTNLKPATIDAVFSGTYKCADGTSLSFPVDLMGHTSIMYFWSQQTPDIEQRLGDVKALQEQLPGKFEVFSFNLDELPDAGEKKLRSLGLDWSAMHLPGGRKNSAYRAYAAKDPYSVLLNAYGHSLVVTSIQEQEISLIPRRTSGGQRGGLRSFRGWPQLGDCLDDARTLSQLQSLLVGDFLVTDPFGPLDPSLPPELQMVSVDPDVEPAARLSRTPGAVPADVLNAIQQCFVPPPMRYRLTSDEALANYVKANELCSEALQRHSGAPDLWIVRNRKIVALVGMWKLEREPMHLGSAVEVAKASLAAELPRGAGVVPQFCLAKDAIRRGETERDTVLDALVEARGKSGAAASAHAAAAILALNANARATHSHHRSLLLETPDDGNPLLWPVTSFLRDRLQTYRLFHATHGRSGFTREERHTQYRNVAGLNRPAEHRKFAADLVTLDGGKLRVPQDTAGRPTLVLFMELPAGEEGAEAQKKCVRNWPGVDVIAAFLTEDAAAVKDLVNKNEWTCLAALVPGGLRNPLVLRHGILSADRTPNHVLLRSDGTISWSVSGLHYHIQSGRATTAIMYGVN
ncbi:MAG: hypothetical protein ACYS9X_07985, partial [Planctomycetota bacterium]